MAPKPMKVLFTHYGDQWIRGSEQILIDLMTNLDPDRIEPILWCNGKMMEDAGHQAGIATYRTGFEYYFDYDSPKFNPRRYWSFVREGISLVRRHDIRVLHANSAAPNQWLLPVARATRRPLLAHLHIDYLRRSRFVCLLHQSTLLVGVSRQLIGDFLSDGMEAFRTQVIYNGIDASRIRPNDELALRQFVGVSESAKVISTTGSLISRKGQDVLIRAISLLDPDQDVHLLVVGDGPERESLERLVAEIGLRERVHFLGYQRDMPRIYQATDIFALASRQDATPLVLVEAGYFSLPCVATAVGGVPELIADGETGLLVPPNDPPALAMALKRLLDDLPYRRELGGQARARVEPYESPHLN